MRINYSIVLVSDMERSVAFYRDVVGIPLKFESPGWTEFVTDGATLALHKSDAPAPEGETRGEEQAGQCRAGFQVPNLDEFHQRMTEPRHREINDFLARKICRDLDVPRPGI